MFADEALEFVKVFGSETDPYMLAYKQNLMSLIRSRYTHEQIMAGEYVMPTGYSVADNVAMVVRAVAAVVAYIPVFGTAVAFVLNVATSIAQGEDISDVLIDGVRGALPGQPMSTAAFDVVRAVAEGKSLEADLIAAIPYLDATSKKYLVVAVDTVQRIANGERISDVALQEIYSQLPPEGQQAMSVGQAIVEGQDVGDVATRTAGALAAAQGKDAVNEFLANAGYQGLVKTLPEALNQALTAGTMIGTAQRIQAGWVPGHLYTTADLAQVVNRISETSGGTAKLIAADLSPANVTYAQTGYGIASRDSLVWHLRNLASYGPQAVTDNEWRRGFDIGTAVSYGHSQAGPGQDAVRNSLLTRSASHGFDAARALQYRQTLERNAPMSLVLRVIPNTAAEESRNAALASQGLVIAMANPQVAAARALNPDPGYKYGFDVGTAAALGQSLNGPGKDGIRLSLGMRTPGPGATGTALAGGSKLTQQGFDTALQLQFGITRSGIVLSTNPQVAAGQLITNGMIGTGTSADQRAGAMTSVAGSPVARAGAANVIESQGFWSKVKAFFGL